VRGQRLRDGILTLTATFSKVIHASTGADVSSASSIEQSIMYSGHGRGRDSGRDRDFGGHGSFGAERCFTGSRQSAPDKKPRHCTHCGWSNHISEKCWEKFDRPEWAQLADSDILVPRDTSHVPSSAHPGSSRSSTFILSQEEYDRLRQSSLSTIIQHLMHLFQVCTPILPFHKALNFRLMSLIPHVRY